MATIKNWRPISEMAGVYLPDDRWTIRVFEAAIVLCGAERRWSVRLLCDGALRETIATGVPTKAEADELMIAWASEHSVIIVE